MAAIRKMRSRDIDAPQDTGAEGLSSELLVVETTERTSSFWSAKWIVLAVLIVLIGLLIGAHLVGWIDLKQGMQKIPGIGSLFTQTTETNSRSVVTGGSLIEKENQELKRKVQELENALQGVTSEKQSLDDNRVALEQNKQALEQNKLDLEQQIAKLELQVQENQIISEVATMNMVDYPTLAKYYQEMKPKEVVPILNHLTDETVLGIFNEMYSDQVAKILAEMDSERAARLSALTRTQENTVN